MVLPRPSYIRPFYSPAVVGAAIRAEQAGRITQQIRTSDLATQEASVLASKPGLAPLDIQHVYLQRYFGGRRHMTPENLGVGWLFGDREATLDARKRKVAEFQKGTEAASAPLLPRQSLSAPRSVVHGGHSEPGGEQSAGDELANLRNIVSYERRARKALEDKLEHSARQQQQQPQQPVYNNAFQPPQQRPVRAAVPVRKITAAVRKATNVNNTTRFSGGDGPGQADRPSATELNHELRRQIADKQVAKLSEKEREEREEREAEARFQRQLVELKEAEQADMMREQLKRGSQRDGQREGQRGVLTQPELQTAREETMAMEVIGRFQALASPGARRRQRHMRDNAATTIQASFRAQLSRSTLRRNRDRRQSALAQNSPPVSEQGSHMYRALC